MPTTTPKLGLPLGLGSDNARDYLKGSIAGGGLHHALTVLDNAILSTSSITLDNVTLNDPTIGPSEWTNANHTHASAATAGSTLGPGTTLSTPSLTTPAVSGVMTFGGDATVQRTGAGALRVGTRLGVDADVSGWASNLRPVQVGPNAAITGDATSNTLGLWSNSYNDGTNRAFGAGLGAIVQVANGSLHVYTAPNATGAGQAQTFTDRMALANTGTLTLTPDAGVSAIIAQPSAGQPALLTSGELRLMAGPPNNILLQPSGGYVVPAADNTVNMGSGGLRYATVYAVAGAINTSSAAVKEGITPLDPSRAMEAVRHTQPVTFDYVAPTRGPEWYDLPDDPEQAQKVLEDRLTAAPLEAAARHQHGFIAEDCDPLFLVGEGQTSPGSSIGVLLAALQNIDSRLSALETP